MNTTYGPAGLRWICTTISKRTRRQLSNGALYPPQLSMGFPNGQVGQLLREVKGITTVLQMSLPGSFPRGRRENIAALRIQTAAKGVNGFVKSMRR